MTARVVIVGGGHAGGGLAAMLRQFGWEGDILLIGEEPIAPYHRPPLSKALLKGDVHIDGLKLRPDAFYPAHGIDLRLSTRVRSIDPAARRVVLEDGAFERYDILVLALGSRPRRLTLPGCGLAGIHELRTAADAAALARDLRPGRRLAIVGAGYVGLEVAASARALGCEVTVIERKPRILPRVAGEILSNFFTAYHRARGVEFITGVEVCALVPGSRGSVGAWPWQTDARSPATRP